jgi:D-alanyl-D-alanine carboxypeptidase
MKRLVLAGVVMVALLPAGAAGAKAATSRVTGAGIQKQMRTLVRMPGGPPGVIAVVQRFGKRSVYTAGVGNLTTGARIRPTDHMRLASTAKAFSGAVALSLVRAGKLRVTDTIGKLVPKLPRAWSKVTLAQALRHTSGLPDLITGPGFIDYARAHPHGTPSPSFLLSFVAKKPLDFRPGSRYHYSNTDNFVVAMMAEAATDRSYNQLLSSLVYRPLGLRQTSLPRGPAMPRPFIHGYDTFPPPTEDASTQLSASYAWASGGLVSTPSDLNKFIRGYAGARLFGRAVQAQQMRFVAGNSEPIGPGVNSAGLGIFRYRTRCGTVYGHTGNINGYTQFMAATRDGQRSVTVSAGAQITNGSPQPKRAAFAQLRRIYGAAVCLALS